MVVLVPGTRRSPGREISPTGIFRVWRWLVVMGSYQGCWVATRAVGWAGPQLGSDRGCNRLGNRGKNRPAAVAAGPVSAIGSGGWSVGVGLGAAGQFVDACRAVDIGAGDRLA